VQKLIAQFSFFLIVGLFSSSVSVLAADFGGSCDPMLPINKKLANFEIQLACLKSSSSMLEDEEMHEQISKDIEILSKEIADFVEANASRIPEATKKTLSLEVDGIKFKLAMVIARKNRCEGNLREEQENLPPNETANNSAEPPEFQEEIAQGLKRFSQLIQDLDEGFVFADPNNTSEALAKCKRELFDFSRKFRRQMTKADKDSFDLVSKRLLRTQCNVDTVLERIKENEEDGVSGEADGDDDSTHM